MTLEEQARLSRGGSSEPVHRMVMDAVAQRSAGMETFVDIGCGTGALRSWTRGTFSTHVGVDGVRYDGMPDDVEFHPADLNAAAIPLASGCGDVVVAVETIEHLENPRALFRELVRLARPGGWVMVTTPNQLSALSLLTLIVKQRFSAFQDVHYPAHVTALLEVDLRRIATECGLEDVAVGYSLHGRIVGTAHHWPRMIARLSPRLFSDNLFVAGRKWR